MASPLFLLHTSGERIRHVKRAADSDGDGVIGACGWFIDYIPYDGPGAASRVGMIVWKIVIGF